MKLHCGVTGTANAEAVRHIKALGAYFDAIAAVVESDGLGVVMIRDAIEEFLEDE